MRIALILILLSVVCGLDDRELFRKWRGEIEISLANNIVGCHHYASKGNISNDKISSDFFSLIQVFPSPSTIEHFRHIKPALTKANREMEAIGRKYCKITKVTYATTNARSPLLPDDIPAKNKANCYRVFVAATKDPKPVSLFDDYYPIDRTFYLLHIANAQVYHTGSVGTKCGRYIGKEGCDSRWDKNNECHEQCLRTLRSWGASWESLWVLDGLKPKARKAIVEECDCHFQPSISGYQVNTTYVSKVFLATCFWDHNYYHFMVDCLPRIAHFIPFLRENKDISIHLYESENYDANFQNNYALTVADARNMRMSILEVLGISPQRIVRDVVFAEEAFIPRSLRCAHAASHPWELRSLSRHMLHGAITQLLRRPHDVHIDLRKRFEGLRAQYEGTNEGVGLGDLQHLVWDMGTSINNSSVALLEPRVIVIMRREGEVERNWSPEFFQQVYNALSAAFPSAVIIVIGSNDQRTPQHCVVCELYVFSVADMLVGEHGAGLTNIMYMRPGAVLVETVSQIDERQLPLCGFYSAMAGGLGIHHYIYAYRPDGPREFKMDAGKFGKAVKEFYVNVTMYNQGEWSWFHSV